MANLQDHLVLIKYIMILIIQTKEIDLLFLDLVEKFYQLHENHLVKCRFIVVVIVKVQIVFIVQKIL